MLYSQSCNLRLKGFNYLLLPIQSSYFYIITKSINMLPKFQKMINSSLTIKMMVFLENYLLCLIFNRIIFLQQQRQTLISFQLSELQYQQDQCKMLQFLGRGMNLTRNISYFIVYIGYGMYNIALGPLIPYLAEAAHKLETQYSFLFAWRTLGMLAGAALFQKYRTWPSRPSYHKLLAFCCLALIALNFLFIQSRSAFYQGFWNFLMAILYFFVEILIDMSIIALNQYVDELILMITASFGLGAFGAPILIRIFGINAYFIFAVLLGSVIPLILYLPSPQVNSQVQHGTEEKRLTINSLTENLLSSSMFIYLGLLITKLAWSSSIAVMAYDYTKQQATIFPSIYSVFNISCKFVWIFLPLKGAKRFKFVTAALLIGSFMSLVLAKLGGLSISLYFDCIIMGIFMSPLASLITSISSDFGRPLTERQASKIATWGVIGQGLLTMFCGQLMSFSVDAYFYFSICICVVLWLATHYILVQLKMYGECRDNPTTIELLALEKVKESLPL